MYLLIALFTAVASAARPGAAPWVSAGDPRLVYSGRWDRRAADRAVTVNTGSRIALRWRGGALALRFDASSYPVPAELPHLDLRIDGGEWRTTTVAERVPVDAGPGQHRLDVLFKSVREWDSRWTPPLGGALDFRGVELLHGARLLNGPRPPGRLVEFLGDSITEGVLVHPAAPGRESWPFRTDARLAYPFLTAERLGAAARPVGFGALGIGRGGSGGVPRAIEAFPFVYEGVPETGPEPNAVVLNLGTNDGGMAEDAFAREYGAYLAAVRARRPHAWIVCLRPFGGAHGGAIRSVVERRAAEGDRRVRYVDTGGWVAADQTTDGVHPNAVGHARAAERLAAVLGPLLRARGSEEDRKPAWIRPGPGSPAPRWGIAGGIEFALWPAAIDGPGDGGPRGLVRVGYPAFDGGRTAGLVNYIAVEPEVPFGRKGFTGV